jgi:hypothetical protein
MGLSSLSPKTISKHVDNLWLAGSEIIRDLNKLLLRERSQCNGFSAM